MDDGWMKQNPGYLPLACAANRVNNKGERLHFIPNNTTVSESAISEWTAVPNFTSSHYVFSVIPRGRGGCCLWPPHLGSAARRRQRPQRLFRLLYQCKARRTCRARAATKNAVDRHTARGGALQVNLSSCPRPTRSTSRPLDPLGYIYAHDARDKRKRR